MVTTLVTTFSGGNEMAKAAERLTKRTLDALRHKAERDRTFSCFTADVGQPGLYAWARRGRVRFVFAYRPPRGGSRNRLQIDEYGAITLEQARRVAQELRGKVAVGIDPQEERAEERRLALTVAEAADGYLADLRRRAETGARRGKRSGYVSARRRLERHVVPRLGSLRLRDVTSDHVRKLHRGMAGTPVEANRTLTAFSAVFGWADRSELVPPGTNPVRYVQKFREEGTRRALAPYDLEALGEVLNEAEDARAVHPSVILAIRLLALTGFRRAEILGHMAKERRSDREGLRWRDVDLESGVVHLHDSKTGAQCRVIVAAAVEVLHAARPEGVDPDDPVCPGSVPGASFVGIDRIRRRLWKAAGITGADAHSLRHSFASIGAHVASGRYVGHVAPLLGHGYQSRAITERYISSSPEALRPAADAISAEIARLLGLAEPACVVAFPGREG